MTVNGVNNSANTKAIAKAGDTKQTTGKETTQKANTTGTAAGKKAAENNLQALEIGDDSSVKSALQSGVQGMKNQLQTTEQNNQNEKNVYYQQLESLREQLADINEQARSISDLLRSGASDVASCQSSLQALRSQRNAIYENINMALLNIKSLENSTQSAREQAANTINQLANSASASAAAVNTASNIAALNTAGTVKSNIKSNTGLGNAICQIGNGFVGKVNTDAQGNAIFSPGGRSQAWCADFATWVVKKACESTGNAVPSGFGSSRVADIYAWAKQNGRFIQTSGMANKAQIIATSVKPGDLFIRNGSTHVGIVTQVNKDGTITTVEGNSSDAVKNRTYTINQGNIAGFVKMS